MDFAGAQAGTGHLFRHDRLIAANTIRATFAGWHDRAIAALLLMAALLAVRAWFIDRPPRAAASAALVLAAIAGFGAGRLIARRLAFHAFDGLLAGDALHTPSRRRYSAAWHGVGLASLGVATLIARPPLLVVSVPAYLVGALIAAVTDGFVFPNRVGGARRSGRALRACLHRPMAGLAAAILMLAILFSARTLTDDARLLTIAVGTTAFALMLTRVDDAVIRFMTVAGHGSRRIMLRHTGGIATFLVVLGPGCWLMLGPVAAGIAGATGAGVLVLLTLRVLAYRLHGRRFADFLVSLLAALLLLVAGTMPVALPVVAIAIFWQLGRRARLKTWLQA